MMKPLASGRASCLSTRPSMARPGTKIASFKIQSEAKSQAEAGAIPTSSASGIGSTARISIMPSAESR